MQDMQGDMRLGWLGGWTHCWGWKQDMPSRGTRSVANTLWGENSHSSQHPQLYREDGQNIPEPPRPRKPATQSHHPGRERLTLTFVTETEAKSIILGATCHRAFHF